MLQQKTEQDMIKYNAAVPTLTTNEHKLDTIISTTTNTTTTATSSIQPTSSTAAINIHLNKNNNNNNNNCNILNNNIQSLEECQLVKYSNISPLKTALSYSTTVPTKKFHPYMRLQTTTATATTITEQQQHQQQATNGNSIVYNTFIPTTLLGGQTELKTPTPTQILNNSTKGINAATITTTVPTASTTPTTPTTPPTTTIAETATAGLLTISKVTTTTDTTSITANGGMMEQNTDIHSKTSLSKHNHHHLMCQIDG